MSTCVNCGCIIGQQFTFQGVVICGDCHKMVSHFIQRTKNELNMLFLTYTDMLRVALVKGELRPPRLPPVGEQLPKKEFTRAFKRLLEEIRDEDSTKEASDGDGTVQGVRGPEDDTRRELRGRVDHPPVRGGRELRPLPQVQEDQHADDHRNPAPGASGPADGVDQTTGR